MGHKLCLIRTFSCQLGFKKTSVQYNVIKALMDVNFNVISNKI